MFVVEFQVDSPFLRDALANVPEATITLEELYPTEDSAIVHLWVKECDLTTFEEGLAADSTVANAAQLAETETRSLYRVTCTDYGESLVTFPMWSKLDISFLDATATHEGWDVRLRMPDRDALQKYREICEERDLRFRLKSIYEERETATTADAQLTKVQREALITAHELGYFAVPRQASLADVAARFEISSQAVSERIRRGTATLIQTSILRASG